MLWELDKNRPICPQIEEKFCVMIANGELTAGEKVMSVRDVAVSASVNPNTVQKAFEGLEAKGLLTSVRGSGWYVCDSTDNATNVYNRIVSEKTREYLKNMKKLGVKTEQIIELIKGEEI